MSNNSINFFKNDPRNGFQPKSRRELQKLCDNMLETLELVNAKLKSRMYNNASLDLLLLANNITEAINNLIVTIIKEKEHHNNDKT